MAAGKGLVAGANALVLFMAARFLEPNAFSVFSVLLGASVFFGRLLLLGCEYGYVRLRTTPELESQDKQLAGAAITLVAIASAVLCLALVGWLAAGSWTVATCSAIWLASTGWACTELAYWIGLANGEPWNALLAQAGTVVSRAAAVAFVALLVASDESSLGLAYGLTGFLLGSAALVRAGRVHAARAGTSIARRLLRYSAWQGTAQVLVTLSVWFGSFVLLFVGKPSESGQFSLAMTITAGVITLAYGFQEYLMVRIVKLPSSRALPGFVRTAFLQTCGVCVAAATLLAGFGLLAPYFFPSTLWRQDVYIPLAASVVILLFHAPLEAVAHFLLAPRLGFMNKVIRLGLVVGLGLPVAKNGGASELALLQIVSGVVGLLYLAVAVWREWYKHIREFHG